MKAQKILIGGNIYGCGNIGDDAVLQGILNIVKKAVPDGQITIATANAQRLNYLPQDVKIVNSYDLEQVTQAIRACDCFISGGGTMIGDELSLNFPLIHNARRIATAKYYGKGVVMLGIGANRLKNPEGIKIAGMLVRFSDLITLRDQESLDACTVLGARRRHTFVTADPAFLLGAKETPRTRTLKARIRAYGKVIGVNIVNEAWADLRGYKSAVAQACDALSTRYGYFPIFFSNEIRPEKKYDFEANRETASLLHCDHEILDPVYYRPEEMIDIISSFDCIIAMRMHALIFAAITGTPFVAVSRVDKVDNFMEFFGFPVSGRVSKCQPEKIIEDTNHVLNQWSTLSPEVENRVARQKSKCWENVNLLRDVLHNPRTYRRKGNRSSLGYLSFLSRENRLKRRLIHMLTRKMTITQAMSKFLTKVKTTQNRV